MRTIGGLLLLFAFGLIILVGVNASGDMLSQANSSNNTNIQSTVSGGSGAIQPIFTVFGFVALLIGAMVAIRSFR